MRDRLETLYHQLAHIDRRLSRSELRLQMSMQQTQITQQAAASLENKFTQISRDLVEKEEGLKSAQKRWSKAMKTIRRGKTSDIEISLVNWAKVTGR